MADPTTTSGASGDPGQVSQVSGTPAGSSELGEAPERSNKAATKRTVASIWQVPAGPGFHVTQLRRFAPDGGVDIQSEHVTIVAQLSAHEAQLASDWLTATAPQLEDDGDGRLHLHARCHLGGRVAAWIDEQNQLTIACGTCWKPIVVLQDHCGTLAGIRALGCMHQEHADGE